MNRFFVANFKIIELIIFCHLGFGIVANIAGSFEIDEVDFFGSLMQKYACMIVIISNTDSCHFLK